MGSQSVCNMYLFLQVHGTVEFGVNNFKKYTMKIINNYLNVLVLKQRKSAQNFYFYIDLLIQ